jgi:hypothetical protein
MSGAQPLHDLRDDRANWPGISFDFTASSEAVVTIFPALNSLRPGDCGGAVMVFGTAASVSSSELERI